MGGGGRADASTPTLATTGAYGLSGDLFVDGALGSRTAWFSQPYADDPGTTGMSYLDADAVYAHLRALTQPHRQAGFHVIGEVAMTAVTTALARLADEVGTPALAACTHRVEHAEMVDAQHRAVLACCGVIASMPAFDAEWGGRGTRCTSSGSARRARAR